MIKLIAAVSKNGVIGNKKTNDLPWVKDKYPQDFKWFKQQTLGTTIIMGRATFESIGSKPLPKRNNIVISRKMLDNVPSYESIEKALIHSTIPELHEKETLPICLIGGAEIYREGMKYADELYVTLIPEEVKGEELVYFPWIDPSVFKIAEFIKLPECDLEVAKYVRIKPNAPVFH